MQESHHGDGAAVSDAMVMVPAPPQIPDATVRNFSDEEIRAMKWKCRLQKASPEFIIDMLQRLPEECIRQTTEASAIARSGRRRSAKQLSRNSWFRAMLA